MDCSLVDSGTRDPYSGFDETSILIPTSKGTLDIILCPPINVWNNVENRA